MNKNLRRFLTYFAFILPYFFPGFAAPLLFRNFPPSTAGHIAGFLFVGACLWTIVIARKLGIPRPLFYFFRVSLIITTIFWSWRFFETAPLANAVLLGIPGDQWHRGLTVLYLVHGVAFILGVTYVRRTTR